MTSVVFKSESRNNMHMMAASKMTELNSYNSITVENQKLLNRSVDQKLNEVIFNPLKSHRTCFYRQYTINK